MRMFRLSYVLFLFILPTLCFGSSTITPAARETRCIGNEILVKFKLGTSRQSAMRTHRSVGSVT